MDLESPWSDFYDLLLQDEASHSETEDEWTSVQKTARGQIECQPISTLMDDTTSIDPEFQTFVNQVLATVSSSTGGRPSPPAQRHYHFHHHNHHSSNWTQVVPTNARSGVVLSETKILPLMPGTFIHNDDINEQRQCPCVVSPSSPKRSSTTTTTTTRFMDVHAWITSIAFLAHLFFLWFRP